MSTLSARRPGRRNWKSVLRRPALAWVVPCVVAGAAIGFFLSRAPDEFVSTSEVVVVAGNKSPAPGSVSRGITAALADLARSRVVAQNVIAALHLHGRPEDLLSHITVKTPKPGILRFDVRDANGRRARQIASQLDLVYSTAIRAHFGGSGGAGLRAAVWDAPSPPKKVSGHELLGSLLGGLGGALAGLLALAVPAWRRLSKAGPKDPQRAAALDARETKLVRREREFAARESELDAKAAQVAESKRQALQDQAADLDQIEQSQAELARTKQELQKWREALETRERELALKDEQLTELDQKLASQASELETLGAELDERQHVLPPPVAEGAPAALRPVDAQGASGSSRWSLGDLERLVEDNAPDHPELVEEWRYYLLYLREFAGPGGRLPGSFDALVAEAFGDLVRAA